MVGKRYWNSIAKRISDQVYLDAFSKKEHCRGYGLVQLRGAVTALWFVRNDAVWYWWPDDGTVPEEGPSNGEDGEGLGYTTPTTTLEFKWVHDELKQLFCSHRIPVLGSWRDLTYRPYRDRPAELLLPLMVGSIIVGSRLRRVATLIHAAKFGPKSHRRPHTDLFRLFCSLGQYKEYLKRYVKKADVPVPAVELRA